MNKTFRKLMVVITIATLSSAYTYAQEQETEDHSDGQEQETEDYSEMVKEIEPEKVSFRTTAYCPCAYCCGKSDGITASGEVATAWHTLASGDAYPFGTIIHIPALKDQPNEGWFVVEDRGVSNGTLDIFFDFHSEALQYGVQQQEAYVYFIK